MDLNILMGYSAKDLMVLREHLNNLNFICMQDIEIGSVRKYSFSETGDWLKKPSSYSRKEAYSYSEVLLYDKRTKKDVFTSLELEYTKGERLGSVSYRETCEIVPIKHSSSFCEQLQKYGIEFCEKYSIYDIVNLLYVYKKWCLEIQDVPFVIKGKDKDLILDTRDYIIKDDAVLALRPLKFYEIR